MDSYIFTKGELKAYAILHNRESIDTELVDYHDAGNEIIVLAEQIKAERAVIAMR